MALINCEECGREISDRAATCPHCGCPVTAKAESPPPIPAAWQEQPHAPAAKPVPTIARPALATSSFKRVVWWVGGLLLFVTLIRACGSSSTTSTSATPAADSAAPVITSEVATQATAAASKPSEEDKKRWADLLGDKAVAVSRRLMSAEDLIKHFPDTPEGKKAQGMVKELTDANEYDKSGQQWDYAVSEEGMSGKSTRTAKVVSTNSINLDFPYSGTQHAMLTIRRHPRWGNDVYLAIERGQILCHSYGDCSIGVRFDDGKVMRFKGTAPSDNSTETVFIPAYSTFMKQLPNAKNVKVEVQIYQSGAPVFEFDVSGFKPERIK